MVQSFRTGLEVVGKHDCVGRRLQKLRSRRLQSYAVGDEKVLRYAVCRPVG
jgi:hypothetical protein